MGISLWEQLFSKNSILRTTENRRFLKYRSYLSCFCCQCIYIKWRNIAYNITKRMGIGRNTGIGFYNPYQKSDFSPKCRLRQILHNIWKTSGKICRSKFRTWIRHDIGFIFSCLPWAGVGRIRPLFWQKPHFSNNDENSNIPFGANFWSNAAKPYTVLKNSTRRIECKKAQF